MTGRNALGSVALLVLTAAFACAQVEVTSRLPPWQTPTHYDLAVHPMFNRAEGINADPFVYYGEVAMHFSLTEASDVLYLHSGNTTTIDTIFLFDRSDDQFTLAPVARSYDETWQLLRVEFASALSPSADYVLFMEFNGMLRDDALGFHRTNSSDDNGLQWFASTNFHPVDARSAFPCMDQPNLKATFQVTLVGDSKTLLSNMPPETEGSAQFNADRASPFLDFYNGDKKMVARLGGSTIFEDPVRTEREVVFQTTPVMHVANLVWIFGDFQSPEAAMTDSGIPVRVYAPEGVAQIGTHARDLAKDSIMFFEAALEMDYPLPKLDFVGIPGLEGNFLPGWGLVPFDIDFWPLLRQPETIDAWSLLYLTSLRVTSAVASSWFENVVTLEWWDDYWFEALSTYFGNIALATLIPEWNMKETVTFQQGWALFLDSEDTIPLKEPMGWETPQEIEERPLADNGYLYTAKGTSVLNMISQLMSEDLSAEIGSNFWQAMAKFLTDFQFTNANSEDLFAVFDQVDNSGRIDWAAMYSSWILGEGFPLLDVKKVPGGVDVTQARYSDEASQTFEDLYYIPIAYYKGDERKLANITDQEHSIHIPLDSQAGGTNNVLKLNIDGAGFYRTRYSDELLDEIVEVLSDPEKSPYSIGDRFDLILGATGTQALKLTMYLPMSLETNYQPWYAALILLNGYHTRLANRDFSDAYEEYARFIISKAVDNVGVDATVDLVANPEEFERSILRLELLPFAILVKHPGIQQDAERLLEAYLDNGEPIHHEVFQHVWNAVASLSDNFFDTMLDIALDSSHRDQLTAQTALGFTRHSSGIERLLDMMTDGTLPLSLAMIESLAANNAGSLQVLEWALDNWQPICEQFCDSSAEELFEILLGRLDNESEKTLVENFFGASGTFLGTTGAARAAYEAALTTIDDNIERINGEDRDVIEFLQEQGYGPAPNPDPTTSNSRRLQLASGYPLLLLLQAAIASRVFLL